ncbi:ABC transporter permease [Paenibacillus doosanensis]|uniref:ABC transporter permease n=1 Tax=Paenibacillus doosanensis TaxID=1229154 RepID=UPI00218070EE|nr:ABC transporter permease [Paenibacillus doosanensis]MCS7463141.1 ABC transporter permease [Paenibacillus doosanensis]
MLRRRSRLASFMVFAGVLLVLGGIGLLSSVTTAWERENGSHRLQKLTAIVDRIADSSSMGGLRLEEAERLARRWNPLPVAYAAAMQAQAVQGKLSVSCNLFGVNGTYRDFREFKMIGGAALSQAAVDQRSRVAVIGAQLADRLFHSTRVAGKTIELYGVPFTVIGVFEDERSLAEQMSDDGLEDVFIPVTAMLDVYPDARIGIVQLAAKPDAAIRGETAVKQAMTEAGLNPSSFRITNDVLVHARISQLRRLLLFGCGMIAIYGLASLMIRQLAKARAAMQARLAAQDWSDVLRSERRLLLGCALAAASTAIGAAGLWEMIRFRLYIPPDWVPEEIIDVSFYIDKLRELWQQQTAEAGYVPAPHERLAHAAGRLADALCFAGSLLGLPLFLLGVRLWSAERVLLPVQLQRLFLCIPVVAAIGYGAARWAGVDYRIDPQEYAVTGAFFIVAVIHAHSLANQLELEGVKLSHVENFR